MVSVTHSIDHLQDITIGRNTDNQVMQFRFDCASWMEANPELTRYRIEVVPPDSDEPYMADTEMDGTDLIWTIRDHDTNSAGNNGKYQIVATGESGESKTSAYRTITVQSRIKGTANDSVPEVIPSVWSKVVNSAQEVLQIHDEVSNTYKQIEALANGVSEDAAAAKDSATQAESFFNKSDIIHTKTNNLMSSTSLMKSLAEKASNSAQQSADRAEAAAAQVSTAVASAIDDTLSQPGMAADAKVVGDEIETLSKAIDEINKTLATLLPNTVGDN